MSQAPLYHSSLEADIKAAVSDRTFSSINILADSNTAELCVPLLPESLRNKASLVVIDAGEQSKNLQNCERIWNHLIEHQADRSSVLLNVGGGMVCDIGGFAASAYKRGIPYINVPTSLLAMADAAMGGKTAINLEGIKNVVGTFAMPQAIILHSAFLSTLPDRELLSGFAEVLKYGLIADDKLWKKLRDMDYRHIKNDSEIIRECIRIKDEIVGDDPFEKGRRKLLNFGHTIGHALESFAHEAGKPLSHGEAVAAGMLVEAYLSHAVNKMPKADLEEIRESILKHYPLFRFSANDYPAILGYMRQDKKNTHGNFRFVLLDWIGHAVQDISCSDHEVVKAFEKYRNL